MKNLTHLYRLALIVGGTILLSAWPPRQTPAQTQQSANSDQAVTLSLSKDESPKKDSVEKITMEIKADIRSKFDSIQDEIKRIRKNHKPRYITRTHTKKVNHYVYDTVMIFIDTCFAKELPPSPPDTVYTVPAKKESRLKIFLNKIFNHKKPREDYIKVIDQ